MFSFLLNHVGCFCSRFVFAFLLQKSAVGSVARNEVVNSESGMRRAPLSHFLSLSVNAVNEQEVSRRRNQSLGGSVHADVESTLRRLVALTTGLTSPAAAAGADAERLSVVYSTYRPAFGGLMCNAHTHPSQLPFSAAVDQLLQPLQPHQDR